MLCMRTTGTNNAINDVGFVITYTGAVASRLHGRFPGPRG